MSDKSKNNFSTKREQEKRECPTCRYIVVNPFARSCPRCNTAVPFEDPGCGSCIHAVSCPTVVSQSNPEHR